MSRLTGSEVKSLMEAYSEVYEQKDEIIFEQQPANQSVLSKKTVNGKQIEGSGVGKDFRAAEWSDKARQRYERLRSQDWRSKISQRDPATLSREAEQARKDQLARASKKPDTTPTPTPSPTASDSTPTPTPRPAAPVLSKKGGVEGTGVGKDFKAKSWSDTERQRYSAASAKAAPTKPAAPAPGTKSAGPESIKPKTPNPLMQRTFGYQTGNSPREQQARADKIVQSGAVKALAPKPTPAAPKPNLQQSIRANRGLSTIRSSYEYDAYDLVLEYLLSEGHADTVEEAHYVMMVMDAEMIGDIVEGYQELNYKRRNRMTDQAMRHMNKGDDASWEKAYSIENQRDTQTPEVSKAKAAANKKRGAAKRG